MRDRPASVRRTVSVAAPARRRLAQASLLGAGAVGASIALLGTSAWLISRASQHPPEASLTLAIVGVQFFGLTRGFLRYGERLVGHDAALRALVRLRVRVYERLEAVAPAGIPHFRRGDLVARMVGDVDSLQDVPLRVVQPYAVAAVAGVATVAVVSWILPGAGLVLFVALAVSASAVPWLTGRLARREEARQASLRGDLSAAVVDLVDGSPELLVNGATTDQLTRLAAADACLRSASRRGAGTTGVGLALTTALAGLASWGGIVLGVRAVSAGVLDGTFLAVLALVPLAAFELVSPLPGATQAVQRARLSAGRVFAVMETPVAVEEPATPTPLPAGPHTLALHDVWAAHPGAHRAALRGVDLDLWPGKRIALVGPSGAGKSTLADVLVRFLPVVSGQAELDGVPLDRLAADDVRSVVGLVEQNPHLFDTTLAENLRVGRRSAGDDELLNVLEQAGLGPWFAGLPDGLSTPVGAAGSRVSGGQRQRIAVARALLAGFPILVLDEPAEHLDGAAADAMTADLLALSEQRTTVLITHRLRGLENVDEIVVLEEGRVVERGDHAELLARGGRFAALWWDERLADGPPHGLSTTSFSDPTEGQEAAIIEGSERP
jgi:thiol reductant ABC exporter CydC subunit